jgi:hypothetical protein
METVLAALGHPTRLWVTVWLLGNGPARQATVLEAMQRSERFGEVVNPGTLSQALKPLLLAGIISRPTARGPLEVVDPGATYALLAAAAEIAGNDAADKAGRAKSALGILKRTRIKDAQEHRSDSNEASI